jgi:hypothetical protein
MLDWFREVQLWSIQDQISMPFALWKNGMQNSGIVLPPSQVFCFMSAAAISKSLYLAVQDKLVQTACCWRLHCTRSAAAAIS